MKLHLTIATYDGAPLPAGSPIKVEIRDTSLADAPAVRLLEATIQVPTAGQTSMVPISLEFNSVPDGTTVWVHVDVDADGRVSKGDYITVESYPVTNQPEQRLAIKVKKVA